MEMTLSLNDISDAWISAIKDSEKINDYCQEHYQKTPVVIKGGNPREAPDGDYCPYVIVMNGSKMEGAGIDTFSYIIGVSWVIKNNSLEVDGKTVKNAFYPQAKSIELNGAKECDELGQIIYEELQKLATSKGWPITAASYDVTPAATYPQFCGTMICTTEITPAMGEELSY